MADRRRLSRLPTKKKAHFESEDDIVVKGDGDGTFIDLSQVNNALVTLKHHANTPTDKLEGDVAGIFTYIKKCLTASHGSAAHPRIVELIKNNFGDTKPETIRPGSVVAYLIGCDLPIVAPNPHCVVTCAGNTHTSIAAQNHTPCTNPVFHFDPRTNHFQAINSVTEDQRSDAKIYMDHLFSPTFVGFSLDNVEALKRYGVKRVKIGWMNGSVFTENDNFVPLDSLVIPGARATSPIVPVSVSATTSTTDGSQSNINAVVFIVIVVLLILLLLFLAWQVWK